MPHICLVWAEVGIHEARPTTLQNSWNLTIGIVTLPIVSVPCVGSVNVSDIGLAELTLCAAYVPSGLVNCGPPAYMSHVPV